MFNKRIALVCNSTNPDLALYFRKKVKFFKGSVSFFAQKKLADELGVGVSSFSDKSGFSKRFFLDAFYSIFVFFKILFGKNQVVIFDTAHISNLPLSVMLKLTPIKQVFTIHDWSAHEGEQARVVNLYNKFVKNVLADEFIVFSKVDSDKPIHQLKLSGFNFIGGREHKNYFLFFGRIEPYKGLRHIIKIAEHLAEVSPDTKIVIAGKGDDKSLPCISKLSNVELINRFIPDDELNELIQHSIGTLLPYDSATQSGVIIHSYSLGKPVIAFEVGELPAYVEQNYSGKVVQHGDITGFVSAMLELCAQSQVLEKNVESYFKSFDESALASQYESVFKRV